MESADLTIIGAGPIGIELAIAAKDAESSLQVAMHNRDDDQL